MPRRFFGLQPAKDNRSGVITSSGESLSEIDHLDSLDAEVEQADRYMSMGSGLL